MTDLYGDLDHQGSVPVYLQIAQLLRQRIHRGAIAPGDMLPSQNQLSAGYQVSVATARQALGVLRKEGLVVTRRGAGSFAATPPPRISVEVGPGDTVTARMPRPAERAALGVAEGVPVLCIQRPGRAEPDIFDANRAVITIGPG